MPDQVVENIRTVGDDRQGDVRGQHRGKNTRGCAGVQYDDLIRSDQSGGTGHVGSAHTGPVSDPVHDPGADQIHQKLHQKIERGQQGDPAQCQIHLPHKCQKEKRHEIVDDRLRDISDIAGIDRVLIAAANALSHKNPISLLRRKPVSADM